MANDLSNDLSDVHNALKLLPQCADWTSSDYSATRQGGLTNRVFEIEPHQQQDCLIVRIAGEGTNAYIDRKVEAHNARMAAAAGVSAEVLYSDANTGLMVSRCIPGIVTMTPDLFQQRAGSPARAGRALKTLHTSGVGFEFRFELFAMIDEYLNVLSDKTIDMPDGYHAVLEQAVPVRDALAGNPVALTPCHCDPLCENFLDDGAKMWIVDWEYSGMNDPYWDLGDLSVEGGFSTAQDFEMMRAYCNGDPAAAEMARMIIYKAMCDLLWTLWGLIQHADGNPVEDFWAYASKRFERCKQLMNSAEFANQVECIRHQN